MMRKISGYLLLLMFLVSGCATIGSIERNHALVDEADGIDRQEAILIAKNGLISPAPNPNLKYNYRVTAPLVDFDQEEGAWNVCFVPKYMVGNIDLSHLNAVYCFDIDRTSGEILARDKYPYSRVVSSDER